MEEDEAELRVAGCEYTFETEEMVAVADLECTDHEVEVVHHLEEQEVVTHQEVTAYFVIGIQHYLGYLEFTLFLEALFILVYKHVHLQTHHLNQQKHSFDELI